MIRAQNRLAPITALSIEYQQVIYLNKSQRLISFRETDRKVMKLAIKIKKETVNRLFLKDFSSAGEPSRKT